MAARTTLRHLLVRRTGLPLNGEARRDIRQRLRQFSCSFGRTQNTTLTQNCTQRGLYCEVAFPKLAFERSVTMLVRFGRLKML